MPPVDFRDEWREGRSRGIEQATAINGEGAGILDMKLEVVVIPVSDVDRAKEFYSGLGWRLDADRAEADADWPDWYARYMVPEQAGTELPT